MEIRLHLSTPRAIMNGVNPWTLAVTLLAITAGATMVGTLCILGQRDLVRWMDKNPRGWRLAGWVFGSMTLSVLSGFCVMLYVAVGVMLFQMGGWVK